MLIMTLLTAVYLWEFHDWSLFWAIVVGILIEVFVDALIELYKRQS